MCRGRREECARNVRRPATEKIWRKILYLTFACSHSLYSSRNRQMEKNIKYIPRKIVLIVMEFGKIFPR